jgi:hypothetical protein
LSTDAVSAGLQDPTALDIKSTYWKDWHGPNEDGRAGLATVTFRIGEVGSDGADLFEALIVAAPLGLVPLCKEDGLVWGRQAIIVDAFRPGETREAVLNFARDYLSKARGTIDERLAHAAQLAHWEHEDINVLHAESPKATTEARLVELSSPDCDLSVGPTNHGDFSMRIHARIGATGSGDNAVYEFLLCTPNRVADARDLQQLALFEGFAFMNRFDLTLLEREVRDICADLKGYTSEDVIAKFGRYARRLRPE